MVKICMVGGDSCQSIAVANVNGLDVCAEHKRSLLMKSEHAVITSYEDDELRKSNGPRRDVEDRSE